MINVQISDPAGKPIAIHETAQYMTGSGLGFYKVREDNHEERSKSERKSMKITKSLDF